MKAGWELAWLALCAVAGFLFAVFGLLCLDRPFGRSRREMELEDFLEEWDSQDQLEGDEEDDKA